MPEIAAPAPIPPPVLQQLLKERFGHDRLQGRQEQVLRQVARGGDALVVMPTGSGKSLCFQLPALAWAEVGTTLVLSPLIALMEDQVAALRARGIRAQYVNSTLDRAERQRRYDELAEGAYELIYATPERMHKPDFVQALEDMPGRVPLLAVDEAHCITRWGHDFRPAYQEVGAFRRQLGSPVTVALTATATPRVREDIRTTLGLDEARMPLFASGIDRPNLELGVRETWDDDAKLEAIREVAADRPGTGIVYFTLIKDLERFAGRLRGLGRPVEVYHGQLPPAVKKRVYRRFSAATPEEGLLLLATNAFGMGVDKADIRFIVHAQLPGSVEAYYQEVGRAGRDGAPSTCLLLYCADDLAIQQQFVEWLNPSAALLQEAAVALEAWPHGEFDADDLRQLVLGRDRGDRRAEACLTDLERRGIIAPGMTPDHYAFQRALDPASVDAEQVAAKRTRDLKRLLQVVEMTRAPDLRAFVLDYFELDGAR